MFQNNSNSTSVIVPSANINSDRQVNVFQNQSGIPTTSSGGAPGQRREPMLHVVDRTGENPDALLLNSDANFGGDTDDSGSSSESNGSGSEYSSVKKGGSTKKKKLFDSNSDASEGSASGSDGDDNMDSEVSSSSSSKKRNKKRSTGFNIRNQVSGSGGESHGNHFAFGVPDREEIRQNEAEQLQKKKELLYQFERLEKRGMSVPKKFNMSSSLDDMQAEFDRLKRDHDTDKSIEFQRQILMAFVSGSEMFTSKFEPFGVNLDGWSENVHENINSYDDIFEELHSKYSTKKKMAPELQLLMTLGGSAFMFHLTNTMFKQSLPGVDQVFKQNPDLMRQMAGATADVMNKSGQDKTGMAGMFSNMFGGGLFGGGQKQSVPQQQQQQAQQPQMRGPGNVDDILRELEGGDLDDRLEEFSTMSSSNLSDFTDTDRSISMKKTGKLSMNI